MITICAFFLSGCQTHIWHCAHCAHSTVSSFHILHHFELNWIICLSICCAQSFHSSPWIDKRIEFKAWAECLLQSSRPPESIYNKQYRWIFSQVQISNFNLRFPSDSRRTDGVSFLRFKNYCEAELPWPFVGTRAYFACHSHSIWIVLSLYLLFWATLFEERAHTYTHIRHCLRFQVKITVLRIHKHI